MEMGGQSSRSADDHFSIVSDKTNMRCVVVIVVVVVAVVV